MQEAQAALLAKDDDLAMLRQDLQALRTQLKRTPDSAAQSATCQAAARDSAAEAGGRPSSSSLKPDPDADNSRKSEGAGAAESGLPSPSLPATPHSPVDSPKGVVHQNPPPPPLPPPHFPLRTNPSPLQSPFKLHVACCSVSWGNPGRIGCNI